MSDTADTKPDHALEDARVAAYLRRRADDMAAARRDIETMAERAKREKGWPTFYALMGPAVLARAQADRVKALRAAAAALDSFWKPIREVTLLPTEKLLSPGVDGVVVAARRLEPQPPRWSDSQSQPYSIGRSRHGEPGKFTVYGSCGFVLKECGQSDWVSPLGAPGEIVKIDGEFWEVCDVLVERWGGSADWFWIATYRRAEVAS